MVKTMPKELMPIIDTMTRVSASLEEPLRTFQTCSNPPLRLKPTVVKVIVVLDVVTGSEIGEVSTWIEDVEILGSAMIAVFTLETIPVVVWVVIGRCEVVGASLAPTSTEVACLLG